MIAALALLAVGTTLAIHVEEVGDVPPALAQQLVAELAGAAEAHAGVRVVIDEDRGGCLAGQPCAAAIRSRTSAIELLLVRLIGGPLRVRVAIEHHPSEGVAGRTDQADLAREGGDVSAVARALVSRTLPARAREPLAEAPSIAPPDRGTPWLAITLLGVGAASAATGVALGVSSDSAVDALRGGAGPASEVLALDDRARTQATAANVLFVVAAGALTAGVMAWILE